MTDNKDQQVLHLSSLPQAAEDQEKSGIWNWLGYYTLHQVSSSLKRSQKFIIFKQHSISKLAIHNKIEK